MWAKKKEIFIAVLISLVWVLFVGSIINNRQKMKGGEILKEELSYFKEFAKEIEVSELTITEYEEAYGTSVGQHEQPLYVGERIIFKEEISIHSVEKAVEVGRSIIRTYHKAGKWHDWTLLGIGHYKGDNVWVFTYSLDQRDVPPLKLIDGAGAAYAVDGDTGEILDAWVWE